MSSRRQAVFRFTSGLRWTSVQWETVCSRMPMSVGSCTRHERFHVSLGGNACKHEPSKGMQAEHHWSALPGTKMMSNAEASLRGGMCRGTAGMLSALSAGSELFCRPCEAQHSGAARSARGGKIRSRSASAPPCGRLLLHTPDGSLLQEWVPSMHACTPPGRAMKSTGDGEG